VNVNVDATEQTILSSDETWLTLCAKSSCNTSNDSRDFATASTLITLIALLTLMALVTLITLVSLTAYELWLTLSVIHFNSLPILSQIIKHKAYHEHCDLMWECVAFTSM
jgi:hypothetical protein